jgi:hypothetical protein
MSSNIDAVVPCETDVFGGTTAHTSLFQTLASRSCRYVIYYFLATSDSTSSIEDVVAGIQTLASQESKQSAVVENNQLKSLLTEKAFPRLERLDVIEYDSRSESVRYHQQPFVEEYAEHAAYQELSADFVRDAL